jgi:lipoate-protein ligase A
LGYNQNIKEVFTGQGDIPFVRRMTGGASILHHQEITYSITCSSLDLKLPHQVKKSYEILCSFIKEFYKRLGLNAQFAKDVFLDGLGGYKNFCFSSYEHFDFIINGKKIGGNAQRRKKDLIFQHGSIPQSIDFKRVKENIKNTDNLENKAACLDGLLGEPTDFCRLAITLAESFSRVFGINFIKTEISKDEIQIINKLLENKYKTSGWNLYKELRISEKRINHAQTLLA